MVPAGKITESVITSLSDLLEPGDAIIDGGIEGERLLSRMPDRAEKAGPDGLLNIDAIADSYWHLHRQHRSAWTHEIDLRPYKESF